MQILESEQYIIEGIAEGEQYVSLDYESEAQCTEFWEQLKESLEDNSTLTINRKDTIIKVVVDGTRIEYRKTVR